MPDSDLTGRTAIVTGASQGFGQSISIALAAGGAQVVGVARSRDRLAAVRAEIGPRFRPLVGDATDADLINRALDEHSPDIVVLNAGARPAVAPIHEQTWESFSLNWSIDTRHVFEWTRAAIRLPLRPGSNVIAISSGAALGSSPLSGGYAPAKSAIRFISSYAAEESARVGLGVEFMTLFPQLTPNTELGAAGVAAYAARRAISVEMFIQSLEPALTPEQVGAAVIDLITTDRKSAREFMISGHGLRQVT